MIVEPGSIKQAHKPNEFVEVEQLEKCVQFLGDIIGFLATESPLRAVTFACLSR